MKCALCHAFFVSAAASALSAQVFDPSHYRHHIPSRVGASRPIAELPAQVIARDGELTLFADYGDIQGESIGLYLVNRTNQPIGFPAQDNDIYVKLEAKTDSGEWERAQTHAHSWCGNSYDSVPALRPGQFLRLRGYYPSTGEERLVRYRLYRDKIWSLDDNDAEIVQSLDLYPREADIPVFLVSNAGRGWARLEAIEAARHDDLAIPFGDFNTVRDLALGNLPAQTINMSRSRAVEALARFPTQESLALLQRFIESDPDRSVPAEAARALARMGLQFEPAERYYQELLKSDDLEKLRLAVLALSSRPITENALRYAEMQLSHEDLPVRVYAMMVLGHNCRDNSERKAHINALYNSPDPKLKEVFNTLLFPGCIENQQRNP